MIADLGLSNIELRHCDIMNVTDAFGQFDYIIAHGVYSWVPAPVRKRMLQIFGRNLSPQGIAYVSYNSYPWSHFRNLSRDIMLFHVRGTNDPHERVRQARGLLEFLSEVTPAEAVYGQVLRDQHERVSKMPDEVLYHDDLEAASTAFWLYQVLEDAAHHGMKYLSEASFSRPDPGDCSEQVRNALSAIPESDIIARDQ